MGGGWGVLGSVDIVKQLAHVREVFIDEFFYGSQRMVRPNPILDIESIEHIGLAILLPTHVNLRGSPWFWNTDIISYSPIYVNVLLIRGLQQPDSPSSPPSVNLIQHPLQTRQSSQLPKPT